VSQFYPSQKQQVVVTGMGCVSPLGIDVESTWQGITDEKHAFAAISKFNAKDWPMKFVAEVDDREVYENLQTRNLDYAANLSHAFQMAAIAADQAIKNAGLSFLEEQKLHLAVGGGIGVIRPQQIVRRMRGFDFSTHPQKMASYTLNHRDSFALRKANHPSEFGYDQARRLAKNVTISTHMSACAAGAQAIGYAYRQIRSGRSAVALAGSCDSLSGEILLAGFGMLGVMSSERFGAAGSSRPFDRQRDGFIAGEGAGFLVLESREHADARGAEIMAELSGYGESNNAYRVTDQRPDAAAAIYAMKMGLAEAGVEPSQVGYINAHGTSTVQNDLAEARAIDTVFSDTGSFPWVSSSKSQIGHLIAGAGSVEAILTILALRHHHVPVSLNLEETDCSKSIRFAHQGISEDFKYALSNSFGFGGTNATLIFGAHTK
jgi:3-oxoacyl-[acyl-carrier-protein] synthase II